jgi:MarR family transcriptional regulator, transcriptional regulator for hemolysin
VSSKSETSTIGKSAPHAINWLLSDLSRLIRKLVDRRLGNIGFTCSQWQALDKLRRIGTLSQARLGEIMGVEGATSARMIGRLEGAGWIKCRSPPIDRRVKLISITEKAAMVMDEAAMIGQSIREDMLVDLSRSEQEQLAAAMSTIKLRLYLLLGA